MAWVQEWAKQNPDKAAGILYGAADAVSKGYKRVKQVWNEPTPRDVREAQDKAWWAELKKRDQANARKGSGSVLHTDGNKQSTNSRKGRKRKQCGTVECLGKDVAKLKKQVAAEERRQGKLTFRDNIFSQLACAANASNNATIAGINITAIELAMAQLRYYDPATPGTYVQAAGGTGGQQKEFCFESCYLKAKLRNNGRVPVDVMLYTVKAKQGTSITPASAYTQGLTDVGAPTATNRNVYFTDSPQVKHLWAILKKTSVRLEPGDELVQSHAVKEFFYDPSVADSHASEYNPAYGGVAFFLQIRGVVGHDATNTTVIGAVGASVDYTVDRTFVIKYEAGVGLEYIYSSDTGGSVTGGMICSMKPAPVNAAYAVVVG
jgi:hypothetical protein